MKQIQIDVLSEAANCPVVQMPGRKFPGVVLQGDSLKTLLDSAEEIHQLCNPAPNSHLAAAIASLEEKLKGYLTNYEHVIKAAGRDLPYG